MAAQPGPSDRPAPAPSALLDEFEDAWQNAPFPPLEPVLARLDNEAARRTLLLELIKIDLDQRWRCRLPPREGDRLPARPLLEDYVTAFPELGAAASLPLPLIREEYWVRHCWGDRPSGETYLPRFPGQSPALRAALAAVDAELALEPGRGPGNGQLGPGGRLGPYLLLETLGAGVTGQVFKARHETGERLVALKVIRPELLTSPDAVKRFYHEIEAAGRLSHAHVVRACDAGSTGAAHFLAMEYFAGIDLDREVKQSGRMPIDQAREYARQAALGLQHIHEHGLVHRDIKPANLLLAETEQGGAARIVKILDLGLARWHRALDDPAYSTLTREGTVMGTPDYMAPEQADDARKADIRADIYSLGCTLYYLLVGRPPFPGGTFIQKVDRHRWETPIPVEELRPEVPPSLAAALGRMMAKSPQDRFATPAEAAAALEPGTEIMEGGRERRGESGGTLVLQRPPGLAARNLAAVSSPAPRTNTGGTRQRVLLAVGVCAALALAFFLWVPPPKHESGSSSTNSSQARPRGETAFDRRIAEGIPETQRSAAQPPEVVAVLGEQRWRQWGLVWSVAFSRNGRHVASAGEERAIRVWDPETGRELMALRAPHHVYAIAYSPDGRFLASGGIGQALVLWDAATGHERRVIRRRAALVRSLTFTPDSRQLVAGMDDGEVVFWDVDTGEETAQWSHPGRIYGIAMSADGRTLAVGGHDGYVRLWDLAEKRMTDVLTCAPGAVRAVAFAPDRRLLAAGGNDGTVRLWELDRSQPEAIVLGRHISSVRTLSFTSDGKTLASGTDGEDRTILLWDIERRRERAVLRPRHERAHEGVFSVAFAPNGKTLASGSPDGTVRIWDVEGRVERSAAPPNWPVDALEVTPDGQQLILGSRHGPGRLWDVESGAETILEMAGGSTPSLALDPVGTRAMFGGLVGISYWDRLTQRREGTVLVPGLPLLSAAYSPDGKTLATGSGDPWDRKKPGEVKLWDTATNQGSTLSPGHGGAVPSVAFGTLPASDGGSLILASAGGEGVIHLWDVQSRTLRRRITGHSAFVRVVAFSPQGRLASGSDDHTLRLWDANRGIEVAAPLRSRRGGFLAVAWSPDGTRLAACDEGDNVAVWEVGSWRRLLLRDMPGPVNQVRFTPDGRYLLTGNANGTVYVLRLPTFSQE